MAPNCQGSSTLDKILQKREILQDSGSQTARNESEKILEFDVESTKNTSRDTESALQQNSPSSTSDSSGPKKKQSLFLMKRLSKLVNRLKDVETQT